MQAGYDCSTVGSIERSYYSLFCELANSVPSEGSPSRQVLKSYRIVAFGGRLKAARLLCREACSVAEPATFYFEQKERVRKFEEATKGGIDRESGRFFADIIKHMMTSQSA